MLSFSKAALFLPPLTVRSVVDICVVAVLIYQLLLIVRGSRAAPVLYGILAVLGLYVAAIWARLEALRTLLSYVIPYTAFAVIVLFQSEIRRTLARVGRKRWLGKGFRRPENIDDILLALKNLAEKKIGALIVLEKDIGLRTFVESGVRLDARLSTDLLLSIFAPHGTLHDGAVIVQKGHIRAAACFLPLTTIPALAARLGGRHRAAIGITEDTDSLSLAVSEETGGISVAAGGNIWQKLTLREVEERIHNHFGVARDRPAIEHQFASEAGVHGKGPPQAEPSALTSGVAEKKASGR